MFANSQWTIVGLEDYPELGEIPEDHDTMVANAIQKAETVFRHTGIPTVADDSGIEVRALDWAPGGYKLWSELHAQFRNGTIASLKVYAD